LNYWVGLNNPADQTVAPMSSLKQQWTLFALLHQQHVFCIWMVISMTVDREQTDSWLWPFALGAEEVSFHWSSALGAEEVRYEGDAVSSSLFMSSANYGVCLAKFPVCCKYVPDYFLRTLAVGDVSFACVCCCTWILALLFRYRL
jgi:hypothetical protein